jgi:molecular chaperone GrpE (heat shock protein)
LGVPFCDLFVNYSLTIDGELYYESANLPKKTIQILKGENNFVTPRVAPPAKPANTPVSSIITERLKSAPQSEAAAIIAKAHKDADLIKRKAEREAEQLKAAAKAQETFVATTETKLKEIKHSVQGVYDMIVGLEEGIKERYLHRYIDQLLEFYNLVSDGYTSHSAKAAESNSSDYVNCVEGNLHEYLLLISDILQEAGVSEIHSEAGSAFSGKLHETLASAGANFNPQKAVIKRSIRSGFRIGEKILQKEKVEV